MTVGSEFIRTLSGRRVVNFHKAVGGHLRHKHLGDKRKTLVERRINARDHKQEQEEHHKAYLTRQYQARAREDSRRNAKAHDNACGVDENAR